MPGYKFDFIQIRSNCLVLYQQSAEHRRGGNIDLGSHKTYSGGLTNGVKKRLTSALDILIQRSPTHRIWNEVSESNHDFKLSFTTLTVADQRNLTGTEAYNNLLKPYLRYMKSKIGLKEYVWKAELQQRGQIHYHLCSNTYVPWKLVRWKWNNLQKQHGYLDGYAKKYGNFNPNSTDIHSVVNVTDALSYIGKEILKNCQNKASVKGKVWDASEHLKGSRYSDIIGSSTYWELEAAVQAQEIKKVVLPNCIIYRTTQLERFLPTNFYQSYQSFIQSPF